MRTQLTYLLSILLLSGLYVPCRAQADSVQMGIASYYNSKFNGRKTSNGEIFRNDSLTAAHKKLPFGTLVKVTNLNNDSVVIVRINDRLPPNSKRSIDLTQQAAKQLNMMQAGIVKARIEVLRPMKKDTAVIVDTIPVVKKLTENYVSRDTLAKDTIIEEQGLYIEGYTCQNYIVIKNNTRTRYLKMKDTNGIITYKRDGEIITEEEFKKTIK